MSGLVTTFNETPYWDDYDPNKQYYRILFRPKLAVQTREVNQLQTMIQEQIKRHADHIFKDGSVVSGCNITKIPRLDYVRINNQWADLSGNITLDETFHNCLVVSNNSGLRANIQLVKNGFATQYPNTNTLYINYINSGSFGGNEVTKFVSGETLSIYNKFQDKHGNILDINKKLGEIVVLTEDLPEDIFSTGQCYALTVGDGVVYQKGYFVKVLPHTIRVKDYDTDTTDMLVGFETTESIITYLQDLTLLDPVDNSNRNAIGADRLKLAPNLVAKNRIDLTEDDDFFPIIEFNNETAVVQKTDPQYAALGDYISRGIFEPHGDFWTKPMIVSTEASSNVSNFNYLINQGITYVKGNRVELIATKYLEAPRAIQTDDSNAVITTLNYGSYVLVDEFNGAIDFTQNPLIDIYDTAQNSISDREGSTAGASGSKIGEARVKMIIRDSGTPGTADAKYRVYLFDINMNATKSFSTQAKALVASGLRADFVLEGGNAVIKEASSSSLIFDLGVTGLKRLRDENGVNDTQFEYRAHSTGTLQANGSVTFTLDSPHAGGTERFFASSGILSNANKQRIDITLQNFMYSNTMTGTVTVPANANLVGTGTSFTTQYKVGEFIRVTNASDHQVRRIVSIANNTLMTLDAQITGSNSSAVHRKYYLDGAKLNLDDMTVTVNSNTQFTVDMNIGSGLNNVPNTAIASYPVLRTGAVEKKKTPRRSHFVKIDCSSYGTSGPWSLGWPDVFKIENVYVGTTYSESNPDRTNWFTLDTGQTPTSYGLSKLVLKPQFKNNLSSSSRIVVKFSFFEADSTTGIGFFSVDSYPCRLPGVSANSSNMSFAEIPTFQGYDLRNSVDFRPQVSNTAVKATVLGSATINPANTAPYNISGSGSYLAEPDTNFQVDLEYYLPRIDLVQVNRDGIFNVKSSTPSINPITPAEDGDSTTVSIAYVPPFPTLSSAESSTYPNSEKIRNQVAGNRTWTMKDITGLAQRIDRLEYYQTLSMLEAQAKDYVIPDENGLDRFKNGIFADPFNNHSLGDVSNFEYNIAVDEDNSLMRPKFKKTSIDLNVKTLTNTTALGNIISLPYTGVEFITQPYASKIRNATESVWNWAGDMVIYPSYDYHTDETLLPEVNVVIDNATPWETFANSPFGTDFGDWRTVSTNTKSSSASAVVGKTRISKDLAGSPGTGGSGTNGGGMNLSGIATTTATTTTTTTTELLNRAVTTLNVGSTSSTYDLGTYVSDFTISPYMRSREVAFIARAMKPNTRYYVYFDGKPVSSYCAPGAASPSYNVSTGTATIIEGKESQVVTRTGAFGTAIVSDSSGNVYGIFKIPEGQFRVGDRDLMIANVSDLVIGADAITSSAKAIYSASSMSITKKSASITTIQPVLSTTASTDVKVNTNVTQKTATSQTTSGFSLPGLLGNTRTGYVPGCADDPLGQSFYINKQENAPGVFLEGIGVYFNSKDPNMGISCIICETLAGVPDSSQIIAKSYLKPSQITVSNDGSAETKFSFNTIPYLANDKYYAFFLMPDGNSPEYTIWMSEVGGTDILTNTKIFSNPYVGVAYKSSNSNSWTPMQTEDIKFNVYRCNFTSLSGSVVFDDDDRDYFTVDGFTIANNAFSPQIGDVVYSQYANGVLNVSNTAPFGVVHYIDGSDVLVIDDSTGGFTANTTIEIHRPTQNGNVSAIGTSSKIATSTIVSVDDVDYSVVVPRVGTITPIGTSVTVDYKGTSLAEARDPDYYPVQMETEREFTDQMRTIRSTSNRSLLSESVDLKLNLYSTSSIVSPIIDLRRKNMFVVENIINNDITDEDTRYGAAETKYVSRQVVLVEGQDAEDIKVFVTGHRPAGTDIHCYIKILNAEDPDQFYSKLWTKMEMTEGSSIRNNQANIEDYSEFGYSFPTAEAQQGEAYLNNGIVTYRNAGGAVFERYKIFAIKLVLVSDRREVVPRMRDVRAICLQK